MRHKTFGMVFAEELEADGWQLSFEVRARVKRGTPAKKVKKKGLTAADHNSAHRRRLKKICERLTSDHGFSVMLIEAKRNYENGEGEEQIIDFHDPFGSHYEEG